VTGWLGQPWDWRSRLHVTLGLLAACALVGVLSVSVVNSIVARGDAVATLKAQRALTVRRIDRLNSEIAHLSDGQARAARHDGRLVAEVAALTAQVRQLGGEPVAGAAPAASRQTTAPAQHRHPRRHHHPNPPPASPTPTPPPPGPSPTPAPTCTVPVLCHVLHPPRKDTA
jgi:hypothetical protein